MFNKLEFCAQSNSCRFRCVNVGAYDAITNFNNDEKATLDILELFKIGPDYYITKCCRPVSVRRKRSSIYRMPEPTEKASEGPASFKKKRQDKNIETEGTSFEKGGF